MTAQELKQRYAAGERNFEGADLSGADLSGADLSGANLSGADFSAANLSNTNLSLAKVMGADFSNANFFGAKLFGTALSGADLYSAKHIHLYGPALTSGRMVYFVRHNLDWIVQAGCFWGSLDRLERAVIKSHNCPWYLGLIQLHRAL